MTSRSPTLFIEHQELYARKSRVPEGSCDYVVRPGKAAIVRAGRDVTLVAWSFTVLQSLEAARALAAEGIEAEVIDLRSLDNAGIDYAAIGASVARTGAVVFVEQAPFCNSLGPRIAAECQRRFFDSFDSPPGFVTAPSVPIPVSRALERACIPTVQDITATARAAARREL